ncbi:adenosylcobinamide-GDP ribazoletransferase [Haloferacaceae archaeon DSL9]
MSEAAPADGRRDERDRSPDGSVFGAIRGAIAFLTRLPVGGGAGAWSAFRRHAFVIPIAGYLVGGLAGLAFFLPVQPTTVVAGYLVALYAVSGITHADGLADVGDALAAHGDAERRTAALKDSRIGVGGALLLGLALVVLALGALGFAGAGGWTAFRLVLAAEVGAKLGMTLVVCYGSAAHEGLGSQLVDRTSPRAFGLAVLLALPALLVPPPAVASMVVGAFLAGPLVGVLMLVWATRALGGVTGDVIGATNELGRAAGLHGAVLALGVSTWLL